MKNIRINGTIGWDYCASDLRTELADANGDSLTIDLYSPGGDVIEGLEMYEILLEYTGHVTVRLGALTASAATIIPCAANWVIAQSSTIAYIHNSWICTCGNTTDLCAESKILAGMDRLIAQAYSQRIDRPLEMLIADMTTETWLLGGEAVVAYGLADEAETGQPPEIGRERELKEKATKIIDEMQLKIESIAEVRPAAMFPRRLNKIKNTLVERYKNKQERTKMSDKTLEEFLTENPKAKVEYDNLVALAVKEVENKNAKQVQDAINNTLNIVMASGLQLDADVEQAAQNQENAGAYALTQIKLRNLAPRANASQIGAVSVAKSPKDTALASKDQAGTQFWDQLYSKKSKEGK